MVSTLKESQIVEVMVFASLVMVVGFRPRYSGCCILQCDTAGDHSVRWIVKLGLSFRATL